MPLEALFGARIRDLLAQPVAAAIRLDAWLRNEAQASGTDRVPTKRIYWVCKMRGPNCARDSRDLRAALAILAERGRARRVAGRNPRIFESDFCHGVLRPSPKGDIVNIYFLDDINIVIKRYIDNIA